MHIITCFHIYCVKMVCQHNINFTKYIIKLEWVAWICVYFTCSCYYVPIKLKSYHLCILKNWNLSYNWGYNSIICVSVSWELEFKRNKMKTGTTLQSCIWIQRVNMNIRCFYFLTLYTECPQSLEAILSFKFQDKNYKHIKHTLWESFSV